MEQLRKPSGKGGEKQGLFNQLSTLMGKTKPNKKTQAKSIGGAVGKSSYETQKGGTV